MDDLVKVKVEERIILTKDCDLADLAAEYIWEKKIKEYLMVLEACNKRHRANLDERIGELMRKKLIEKGDETDA